MILLDFNPIVIANIAVHFATTQEEESEDIIRHMVLNTIRSYNSKYRKEYGELVICCDSRTGYWRKEFFPFYKANRKISRNADSGPPKLNWSLIHNTLDKMYEELKEFFPYKIIQISGAEADDVIAILTKVFSPSQKILIVSGDEDFIQLQKYTNVYQFSPRLKNFIKTKTPKKVLKEHIIRGDSGDGVPNMLSEDNVFVTQTRQKSINSKKLELWLTQDPATFCSTTTAARGWARNKTLIDFDCIPLNIENSIIDRYNEQTRNRSGMQLLNYFIDHRLSHLINYIEDFTVGGPKT